MRKIAISALVALAIAALLTALGSGGLGDNLVYSLLIAGSIHGCIELARALALRVLRRRGAAAPELHGHWPGWRTMAPAGLVAIVVGFLLGSSVAAWLLGRPNLWTMTSPARGRWIAVALVLNVVVGFAVTWLHWSINRIARADAQAQSAARTAAEAQLRLLQSQLEPHMLFNTLANLRALIGADPKRAQAMLDRLIAFLRATLAASRADGHAHALADEFARLDDYLALMAVRMGPRLAFELHLPPELRGVAVPPLLLQPLVENAIRHGLEPSVAGGRVDVRARRDGENLTLEVSDSGVGLPGAAPLAPHDGASFGLAQIRERLRVLHGDAASLAIAPAAAGSGVVATVRLPFPDAAPRATDAAVNVPNESTR